MTEQTTRHTPGPWTVDPEDTFVFGVYRIREVDAEHYRGDEDLANARLIAAAPDLLAALATIKSILDYRRVTEEQEAVWRIASIAIAQATGADR